MFYLLPSQVIKEQINFNKKVTAAVHVTNSVSILYIRDRSSDLYVGMRVVDDSTIGKGEWA